MRRVGVSFAVAACWVLCSLAPAGADDSLPENGKISFANYDAIYTVEPDGSNPRPLIKDAYLVDRPVWSPDGTKIVFTHQQESTQSHLISVMNADGSDLRALYTKEVNQFAGPTWSPDGTKLAFSKGTGPTYANDIFMMDLDGSNLINVTKTPETVESYHDFSPDGSQMCHYRGAGGLEEGMFVTNVDSSNLIRLIDSRAVDCAWSPDGKRIASQHYGSSISEYEVYVMNADGSGKTNLTSNRARDENPDWSPDGTKITFASDRDGDYDIYTMDADGSDVEQVTNLPGDDLFPDWQPLPRPASSKDADGSDVDQGTKKPAADDVDRERPERTVIIKPGDTLWSISEERLGPEASPQRVYDHTYQMYALNRKRIGSDPDLIFAEQRLSLPPLGEG